MVSAPAARPRGRLTRLCRPRPVGVGNCERAQNCALGLFHRLGIRVGLVIITDKMQEAMDWKMGE